MDSIIISTGTIVLMVVGLIAVIAIALFIFRQTRIAKISTPNIVLAISVPKENEKTPLSAEQLFSSLHGLRRNFLRYLVRGHVHMSFEIVAKKNKIMLYVVLPQEHEEFVINQIYAQYPDAKIEKVEDYAQVYDLKLLEKESFGANIVLNKSFVYPIRTFVNFEVDPLAAMTSSLSQLQEGEEAWFQMVLRPVGNNWQKQAHLYVSRRREGKSGIVGHLFFSFFREVFFLLFVAIPRALIYNRVGTVDSQNQVKLSDSETQALKLIEEKTTKLGFAVNIRMLSFSSNKETARQNLYQFVSTMQQFTMPNLNGFKIGRRIFNTGGSKEDYKMRKAKRTRVIFNTEELASVYHLPNAMVTTPSIVWSRARKGEPPPNLPVTGGELDHRDLTIFAQTDFRHEPRKFGIKQADRLRHTYVIGKTGMGKSTMLANMAVDDIRSGRGVAVVDPHGDLIETIIDYIPNKRVNDVVMFSPADRDFPVALNMLESVDATHRNLVASGLIAVFYKIYANSWGPRLEHILRNTILALLDAPNSTLLGIPRMLVDKRYRSTVMEKIDNPTVSMFWENEFPKIETSRTASESLGAIQNKVGQFLSTPIVRNIVGQQRSTIDLRKIMDDKQILLVNLSKGQIGEDVSALLGAMMITKLQLSAMSRADIPEEQRTPYYLYVDEFQNFATTSFATILSEARKYKLGLTMANQYIEQMPEDVRAAVFGNVGTLISFAIGANDAPFVAKEFQPVFTEEDLIHLDKYNIYLRLTIDGKNSEPYSATTLPLPINTSNNREKVLKICRERYSKPVDKVETYINKWHGFERRVETLAAAKEEQGPPPPAEKSVASPKPVDAPKPTPAVQPAATPKKQPSNQ